MPTNHHYNTFYIDGHWVEPTAPKRYSVINPATEAEIAAISLGSVMDVNRAVAAARKAFEFYSLTPPAERLEQLERIAEVYRRRMDEMAETISREMGAPITLARTAQAPAGLAHLNESMTALRNYKFEELKGQTLMRREAVGVCGLITPWNWPMNQIVAKVAPALATGCTMVLKPSELAPLSAFLLAEIIHEAGVPPGVFNLVNGDGPTVGAAMACHPHIDMISFTGSTRGGIAVACAAASTVKRVTPELGGKSAHVIVEDADIPRAVTQGVQACFRNSGQSCNAPTRMLVPSSKTNEVVAVAKRTAEATVVGLPSSDGSHIGPLANRQQFEKVQQLINIGIEEGADLVAGGPGRPESWATGYFVKPTVFASVRTDMTIAREEIFGPVLSIMTYDDEEDAIQIANDTVYGLSAYVSSGNSEGARRVAKRLRCGQVHANGARVDCSAGLGGCRRSGSGREWGVSGLEEFLELKAIFGYS